MKARDLLPAMSLLQALKDVKTLRNQLETGVSVMLSSGMTGGSSVIIIDTQFARKLLDETETGYRKQLEELGVELERDE